jgi:hypothetical protein
VPNRPIPAAATGARQTENRCPAVAPRSQRSQKRRSRAEEVKETGDNMRTEPCKAAARKPGDRERAASRGGEENIEHGLTWPNSQRAGRRGPFFTRPADAARTACFRRERLYYEPVRRMAPEHTQSTPTFWTPKSTKCPATSSTSGQSTKTTTVLSTSHCRHLVVHSRTLRRRVAKQALPCRKCGPNARQWRAG